MLNDIKVLDLSQYIPGPYVSRMLCDLGAEVIKLEPPGGDPMRYFMQEKEEGVSPLYCSLNRGKKIFRLDLKTGQGLDTARQLLEDADVLIDGFRPGTLERLGLGRGVLEDVNQALVHCALSGYGQTGPYAYRAGHDLGYCAVAGMFSFRDRDSKPEIPFPPPADHVGALQACNSILAGLYSRSRTGRGVFLDCSLYEPLLSWRYPGQSERAVRLLSGGAACYNIYQTADDRYVTLAAIEVKFWTKFCLAVEKPEWVRRQYEVFPQSELIKEVSELFRKRSQQHWNRVLEAADCCYEPVPDHIEVTRHVQSQSRGLDGAYPCIVDGNPLPGFREILDTGNEEIPEWGQ